jgi:hypothetical protein
LSPSYSSTTEKHHSRSGLPDPASLPILLDRKWPSIVVLLAMAADPVVARIDSLSRLLILLQSNENNDAVIFGIKIVGQKDTFFKKRTEEVI